MREPAINLLNTITRREESYHRKVKENIIAKGDHSTIHEIVSQKEEGLDKLLVYDNDERLCLIDHLLDKDLTIEDFDFQRGVATLSNNLYEEAIKKQSKGYQLKYCYRGREFDFSKKIRKTKNSACF